MIIRFVLYLACVGVVLLRKRMGFSYGYIVQSTFCVLCLVHYVVLLGLSWRSSVMSLIYVGVDLLMGMTRLCLILS